ncbi:acyltransferase [Rossellomorea sp. KS-H15a]|uniref:acyltransferase n=1 Tax=Rossellomorea sp. KS-H15a TaxID=2963940 RepID=UPI0020C6B42C|nr:acyltransferase family protein [Rossellomorea sp. KS-H15a]UTE77351.1 acyltransferase family protein [Rossellomorea sp. KS-H15a]
MISYINILRSLAIIGVIIIHSSGPLLSFIDNPTYWWVGNVYDGLVRWCVPLFVMISGTLLLNPKREDSLQVFLKKRASKIVLPFIAWIVFYSFWKYKSELGTVSIPAAINEMINGTVYFHLWFLYMIVGIYLITPLIQIVIRYGNRSIVEYYLVIWFITSSLFPLVKYILDIRVGLQMPYFTGYLGYFILGYYLHHIQLSTKIKNVIYSVGILSVLITITGTYLGTKTLGTFDGYYYEYLSPNNVFASIAIFILFKSINWDNIFEKNGPFMKVTTSISNASFGIYLIHPLVMDIISSHTMYKLIGIKINYNLSHPFIGTPITILVVLILSFISIWVMRKIPFIKKLVP